MTALKPHDIVRCLISVQIPGWRTTCTPGYHFTVQMVNDDGTLLVSRSGPEGKVVVKATDVERAYKVFNGVSYSSRTTEPVVAVLESVRKSGQRIRIRLGDRETGRDWLEEFDVEGTIGTSMGPTKIPLIIHNRRSRGGPGLSDDAIIRISTTGTDQRTLYCHPLYHTGRMEIVPARDEGYAVAVNVDGKPHALFKTEEKGVRWVRKMSNL